MNLAWLLYSFEGRIGRRTFVLLWVSTLAVQLAVAAFLPPNIDDDPTPQLAAAHFNKIWPSLLAGFFCAWANLASIVKRRHDFGGTGWPLLADILACAAGLALWWVSAVYRNVPLAALTGEAVFFLGAAYALWLVLLCAFYPGEKVANFYGPSRVTKKQPSGKTQRCVGAPPRIVGKPRPVEPAPAPAPAPQSSPAPKAAAQKFGRR
ncbi:DUF805 domain-containing protein [Methylocystis heyeri]|uniref:DUF805 domain-containing protein n=1 Tax=Methylocystis heyeri TaxID=391905 RepID=UPI00113F1C63|nr:DUF805 domain-containing protein [Methylocystis heyeri]